MPAAASPGGDGIVRRRATGARREAPVRRSSPGNSDTSRGRARDPPRRVRVMDALVCARVLGHAA